MELTLVRKADIDEISCAAAGGDVTAAELLRGVMSFEAGHRGKRCLTCDRMFKVECGPPGAFWVSSHIAIGICQTCAAKPDRQLRRIVKKYKIERLEND